MTNVNKIIGIDISKEKFDVCFSFQYCSYSSRSYSYNAEGIKLFLKDVPSDSICIMEATGVYHLRLAYALNKIGVFVSVVNPLSVKNFSRAIMCRTKTDKADARQLVDYARRMELTEWRPTPDGYIRIQQIYRSIELFLSNITQCENQLEAIDNSPVCDSKLCRMLRKHIKTLYKQITQLEKQIEDLIAQEDATVVEHISSVPGVGKKTAIALLTATKGMHGFENYRQLSSYFGLCPRIYDSGKSVHGKAHICKMGMGWIRKLLYMCSISAIRHNRACAALYIRLKEKGKPIKVILIAVVNKLLKQIFAIVKSNSVYSEILT
jgi:transposase